MSQDQSKDGTVEPLQPRHAQPRHTLPRQLHGIGLIEVLIAVVLLSIGFLAAARMQVEGMRFSRGAYYQSQAYFLANDMMNRMRANTTGVREGHYDSLSTSSTVTDPNCEVVQCTPEQLTQQDLYDWSTSLHRIEGGEKFNPALPDTSTHKAVGTVSRTAANRYEVELNWGELIQGTDMSQTLKVAFEVEAGS